MKCNKIHSYSCITRISRSYFHGIDRSSLLAKRVVPFQSDIRQSWCNSDFESELFAIKYARRQSLGSVESFRVLLNASGGDCPLAILGLPQVSSLACVSPYISQHHLTTLKLALAISDLPKEQLLVALGMEPGSDPTDADAIIRRKDLYENYVAPILQKLNPSAAQYWNDRLTKDIAFGVGQSGREQRWRADRLVQLHKMDLFSSDVLYGLKFPSLEVIEEGLMRAISASDMCTIMGWQKHKSTSLTDSELLDLHRCRALREAKFYISVSNNLAVKNFERSTYFANMFLFNSFCPEMKECISDICPIWMTDSHRIEVKNRFYEDFRILEKSSNRTGLLKLSENGLFEWQFVSVSMSGVAQRIAQDARENVFGIDLVSTGEMLDYFGSFSSACSEMSKLARTLATGGVIVGRRVQGELNSIMAPHLILESELNESISGSEMSPWYWGSQQHVLAGIEDSL